MEISGRLLHDSNTDRGTFLAIQSALDLAEVRDRSPWELTLGHELPVTLDSDYSYQVLMVEKVAKVKTGPLIWHVEYYRNLPTVYLLSLLVGHLERREARSCCFYAALTSELQQFPALVDRLWKHERSDRGVCNNFQQDRLAS
jgi:hypothetical protein